MEPERHPGRRPGRQQRRVCLFVWLGIKFVLDTQDPIMSLREDLEQLSRDKRVVYGLVIVHIGESNNPNSDRIFKTPFVSV